MIYLVIASNKDGHSIDSHWETENGALKRCVKFNERFSHIKFKFTVKQFKLSDIDLNKLIGEKENAWRCSFDDDTMVTPIVVEIQDISRTEAPKVEEVLKLIEKECAMNTKYIRLCKEFEATNLAIEHAEFLTKIRNVLEG